MEKVKKTVATMSLFTAVIQYAVQKKVDILAIAVNPKHVSFYTLVGFEVIGKEKHYTSVNAPAVALVLRVKDLLSKKMLLALLGKKTVEQLRDELVG